MSHTQAPHWWQRGVIYQVYPRSFKDSNGDGIGDIPGIIEKLDYLKALGIDAIWMSPFYKSPMADFGYDVADYCDIDPMFGTLADFDQLVQEAHARGLKIVIDWVPNHSSDQHVWFQESRSSRDNPKRDWYIWRDAKPDGTPPNNWGSWFGGSAWEWDEPTQQYYLHSFVKEQPDLNWANPEVYAAMTDVLHFWLKRGVDGFRMDVVFLVVKDPDLRDNPINPNANPNLSPNDIAGRQIHQYDRANPGIHDVMQDFRRITDQYGDTVIVGEIWEFDLKEWVRYYGDTENNGIQLPFNFRLMEVPRWDAGLVRASVDELEAALPPFAWPNYVLNSHDKPRIVKRIGAAQARIAAMLLLTLRGTPTLYNGEELGMTDGYVPPEKIQDPQGLNLGAERSRDGCRTPFQWDTSPYAGFSTVEPWLPVGEQYPTVNAATESQDPRSMLTLYTRLLALRRASPELHIGTYRAVDAPDGVFAYVREDAGKAFLVALNFTDESKTLTLEKGGTLTLSTHLDREGETLNDSLTLRADEGVLMRVR